MIREGQDYQMEHYIPYSFMQEIQRKSDISAPYILFSLLFSCVLVSSGYLSQSLTNTITFVLPIYWTLKAVELRLKQEDKQWLTYWLIWTFFYFLDLTFSKILNKFPNFYLIKLLFFIWLFLPSTMGAQYLYHNFFSSYSDRFNINFITSNLARYKERLYNYIKEKFGINLKDYEIQAELERKERDKIKEEKAYIVNNQHEARQNIISNAKIDTDLLQTGLQNVREEFKHTIDQLRGKKEGAKEVKPLNQEQLIEEGRNVAGHPPIEVTGCIVTKRRQNVIIENKDDRDLNLIKDESENKSKQ